MKREDIRAGILTSEVKSPGDGIGAGLFTARDRGRPSHSSALRGGGGNGGWNQRRPEDRRTEEDRSKLVCSNCGKRRHTKDQCFELVGYPYWWESKHKSVPNRPPWNKGHAATAVGTDGGLVTVVATEGNRELVAYARGNEQPAVGAPPKVAGAAQFAAGTTMPETDKVNEGAAAGGKRGLGLGFSRFIPTPPNPTYFNYLPHCENIPHSAPQTYKYYRGNPDTLENSENSPIECKNRFQVLQNFGTAYVVSPESEKNNR